MYNFLGWDAEDARIFLQSPTSTHDKLVEHIRMAMIASLLTHPDRNPALLPDMHVRQNISRPVWDVSSSESDSSYDSDDDDEQTFQCGICGDITYCSQKTQYMVCLVKSCIQEALVKYANSFNSQT